MQASSSSRACKQVAAALRGACKQAIGAKFRDKASNWSKEVASNPQNGVAHNSNQWGRSLVKVHQLDVRLEATASTNGTGLTSSVFSRALAGEVALYASEEARNDAA